MGWTCVCGFALEVSAISTEQIRLESRADGSAGSRLRRNLRNEKRVLIRTREIGETTILDLNGPLMVGESEMESRQKLKELLERGSRRLAINLAGVPEMDSWGLGALVRHCTQVKRAGGRCVFFAPVPHVQQLLKTANLDSVLDIVGTEAEALSR